MNNKKRNYCICGHDMDDEGCIVHEVKNGMIVPKEKYAYKGSLTPTNTPMTQQTLREEAKQSCMGDHIIDFFFTRFKEFAEKELIRGDEKLKPECSEPNCWCSNDIHGRARNALRNEQREILAAFMK